MSKSKKTKKSAIKSRSLNRHRSNFFAKTVDTADTALKKRKSLKLKLNVSKTFVSFTSQFAKKIIAKLSLVTFASSLILSFASEAENFDEEKKKKKKKKKEEKKRNDLATIVQTYLNVEDNKIARVFVKKKFKVSRVNFDHIIKKINDDLTTIEVITKTKKKKLFTKKYRLF